MTRTLDQPRPKMSPEHLSTPAESPIGAFRKSQTFLDTASQAYSSKEGCQLYQTFFLSTLKIKASVAEETPLPTFYLCCFFDMRPHLSAISV